MWRDPVRAFAVVSLFLMLSSAATAVVQEPSVPVDQPAEVRFERPLALNVDLALAAGGLSLRVHGASPLPLQGTVAVLFLDANHMPVMAPFATPRGAFSWEHPVPTVPMGLSLLRIVVDAVSQPAFVTVDSTFLVEAMRTPTGFVATVTPEVVPSGSSSSVIVAQDPAAPVDYPPSTVMSTVESTARSVWPNTVTVTGRVIAKYAGKAALAPYAATTVPCALCRVEVYDADEAPAIIAKDTYNQYDPDEFLGGGFTDMNGYYSIPVNSFDTDGGIDPALNIYWGYSTAIATSDGNTMGPVMRQNCPTSGSCALGTWEVTSAQDAAKVWVMTSLAKGWKFAKDVGGFTAAPVKFYVSPAGASSASYWPPSGSITITGDYAWNQDIHNAEQGHALAHQIYGSPSPYGSACGSGHGFLVDSNPTCAWDEGFSYYFALMVKGSPVFRDELGNTFDFQNVHLAITPSFGGGAEYESLVAGTLWDVTDAGSEGYDFYQSYFDQVVRVMQWGSGAKTSLAHFYDSWKLYGYSNVNVREPARQNHIVMTP